MRYLRCECGKAERWDTGETVHPCQGCAECNTTFATSPGSHLPLGPHVLVDRYDERTGALSRQICTACHKSFPLQAKAE